MCDCVCYLLYECVNCIVWHRTFGLIYVLKDRQRHTPRNAWTAHTHAHCTLVRNKVRSENIYFVWPYHISLMNNEMSWIFTRIDWFVANCMESIFVYLIAKYENYVWIMGIQKWDTVHLVDLYLAYTRFKCCSLKVCITATKQNETYQCIAGCVL